MTIGDVGRSTWLRRSSWQFWLGCLYGYQYTPRRGCGGVFLSWLHSWSLLLPVRRGPGSGRDPERSRLPVPDREKMGSSADGRNARGRQIGWLVTAAFIQGNSTGTGRGSK